MPATTASSQQIPPPARPAGPEEGISSISDGVWNLDPARSSVEFRVPGLWGLVTVEGRFSRYEGRLDPAASPAVELRIDAPSLQTGVKRRDEHLRSADFFDVANHPEIRFVGDRATLESDTLKVDGRLHAAGKMIPLHVDAIVREVAGEAEVEAVALADHRQLGMTWNPLGMVRAPSELIVRGRLIKKQEPGVLAELAPVHGGTA